MSSLHIVSTSAYRTDALLRAVQLAAAGDAILVIEDGVYAAADTTTTNAVLAQCQPGVTFYALAEDLAARALPACAERFKTVDYAGFVELVCQHQNSVSWS